MQNPHTFDNPPSLWYDVTELYSSEVMYAVSFDGPACGCGYRAGPALQILGGGEYSPVFPGGCHPRPVPPDLCAEYRCRFLRFRGDAVAVRADLPGLCRRDRMGIFPE